LREKEGMGKGRGRKGGTLFAWKKWGGGGGKKKGGFFFACTVSKKWGGSRGKGGETSSGNLSKRGVRGASSLAKRVPVEKGREKEKYCAGFWKGEKVPANLILRGCAEEGGGGGGDKPSH